MKHEIFNLVEIVIDYFLEIAVIHDMVKNDWMNNT